MTTKELIDFVRKQKETGVSREVLTNILQQHGWDASDVAEAYAEIEAADLPVNEPNPPQAQTVQPPVTFSSSIGGVAASNEASDDTLDASVDAAERMNLTSEIEAVLNPEGKNTPSAVDSKQDRPLVAPKEPELPNTSSYPESAGETPVSAAVDLSASKTSASDPYREPVGDDNDAKTQSQAVGAVPNQQVKPVAPEGNGQAMPPSDFSPASSMGQSASPAPVTSSPVMGAGMISVQESAPVSAGQMSDSGAQSASVTASAVAGEQAAMQSPPMNTVDQMKQTSTPAVSPAMTRGMQTMQPQLPKGRDRSRIGLVVGLLVILLLLLTAGLHFFGVVSIPGLPSLETTPAQSWQRAIKPLANGEIQALAYEGNLSIAPIGSPGSEGLNVSIRAEHEFFSPESQIGNYKFSLSYGGKNVSGDVLFQGGDVFFRTTQATEGVRLAGVDLSQVSGGWFRFSSGTLKENAHLLLDTSHMPAQSFAGSLSEALGIFIGGARSEEVIVAANQSGDGVLVGLPEQMFQQTVQQLMRLIEPYAQGYLDISPVQALFSTVDAEQIEASLHEDTQKIDTIRMSLTAMGTQGVPYEGEVFIDFLSFNHPVVLDIPSLEEVSLDEYLIMKNEQAGSGGMLAINGDRLLLGLRQSARFDNALDYLAQAQRHAIAFSEQNGSYEGVCGAETVNQSLAGLASAFPGVTVDCRTDGEAFVLLAPFDSGYLCADTSLYVGQTETIPASFACFDEFFEGDQNEEVDESEFAPIDPNAPSEEDSLVL